MSGDKATKLQYATAQQAMINVGLIHCGPNAGCLDGNAVQTLLLKAIKQQQQQLLPCAKEN